MGADKNLFLFHLTGFPQAEERLIEEEHAFLAPGLDARVDAVSLVLADEVGDGWGDHHHFVGRHHALGFLGHEALRKHADECRGKLGSDLVLRLLREDIDDTVDGAGGAVGVQRAEHHVTGFSGLDGGMDGLEVTHFAHQDHIRVHAQRAADAFLEAADIDADLALVEQAFLVLVEVLDGVFQRDDMLVVVVVDEVEHAGQRGGFSRAGGAGDQQQAARAGDEALDHLGHADLLEGEEAAGDPAKHHADGAALLENGAAEAVAIDELDGKVGASPFLKLLLVAVGSDGLHERHGVVRLEDLGLELAHAPAFADEGGLPHADMKVGGLEVDDRLEQLVDEDLSGAHGEKPFGSVGFSGESLAVAARNPSSGAIIG